MSEPRQYRGRHNGGWKYGFLSFNSRTNEHEIVNSEVVWPVISETVGQATGLKDKNGKMIFEGDVFQTQHNKYPVEWDEEEAMFKAESSRAYLCVINWGKYEITGTIHDNPQETGETNAR